MRLGVVKFLLLSIYYCNRVNTQSWIRHGNIVIEYRFMMIYYWQINELTYLRRKFCFQTCLFQVLFCVEMYFTVLELPFCNRDYDISQIFKFESTHYYDVIMTTIASQITSLTVVYSTVYSDTDQRKYQSSASLAFVWGIHRDRWIPRTKGQLRGKCFHLMTSSWTESNYTTVWLWVELVYA